MQKDNEEGTLTSKVANVKKQSSQAKTAISYIRTATLDSETQAKTICYSEAIREKARQLEAKIVTEWKEHGFPSESKKRPRLTDLMSYLEENHTDYLIVPRLSMLSRNTSVLLEYVDRIEQLGTKVISVSENETAMANYLALAKSKASFNR